MPLTIERRERTLQDIEIDILELIPMASISAAYEQMLRSDVKYRFVNDLATLN